MLELDQNSTIEKDLAKDFFSNSLSDDHDEHYSKSESTAGAPCLSPIIFWDTDPSKIDWDKRLAFVIARAVMYGVLSDWKAVCTYYGLDRIREEMIEVRNLDPKSLHFLSLILNVPKEQFRCYTNQQFQTPHWNY